MRALIATAIFLLSGAAFGADCPYVNTSGDSVTFVSDGENTVRVSTKPQASCSWGVNGDTGFQDIACSDGTDGPYFFGPSARLGSTRDLLIFDSQIWYRNCK